MQKCINNVSYVGESGLKEHLVRSQSSSCFVDDLFCGLSS